VGYQNIKLTLKMEGGRSRLPGHKLLLLLLLLLHWWSVPTDGEQAY
jgi:hypothetical protein